MTLFQLMYRYHPEGNCQMAIVSGLRQKPCGRRRREHVLDHGFVAGRDIEMISPSSSPHPMIMIFLSFPEHFISREFYLL